MQSPLGKSARSHEKRPGLDLDTLLSRGRSSARHQATLIGPVERQIEFSETGCRQFDGLPAVQDRLDQLRAQKGEVDEAPDIATRDTIALGQFPERPGASRGKLLEPSVPACDRLDQRGVTSRAVVL